MAQQTNTQTVINRTELSPEQRQLVQMELEQARRRAEYENFMSGIVLGVGTLGGTPQPTQPGTTAPQQPSAPTPPPPGPGALGGMPLAPSTAGALTSVGQLQGLNARTPASVDLSLNPVPNAGGSINLDWIKNLVTPENVGTVLGAFSGVPGGATLGGVAGSAVGGMLPQTEPVRNDSTQGNIVNDTSVPRVEANRSDSTQGNAPSGLLPPGVTQPTQGQISAARAQDTAMDAVLFNSRFDGMGYSGENTVNEPGAIGQNYGNTVSGYMNSLASWGQEIGAYLAYQQGIQPGTPEYGAFMEQTIKTIMQASDPQAVGQQLLGIKTDPNVRPGENTTYVTQPSGLVSPEEQARLSQLFATLGSGGAA